ncbi:MAG TPA: response regulator [Bryobacteraceae bacterium]|jgi:PAS domain S-box-containing protein|nr:response regulator [Bryobacteraceae bacterium]
MSTGALRILLIDDDPVDRDILRCQLSQVAEHNIELEAVDSGSKGLDRIRAWRPDCVLLDLNLPDMRGLDLLRAAVKEFPACPLIVITAYGSEQIAAEAMRQGAADYLIKSSLSASTLAHSIENVLEREALRRKVEEQRLHIEERNRELEAALARERLARVQVEESERKYRTLAEAVPQVVWTALHPSGELDYVNERWCRATGTPASQAMGHGWTELLHEDDRAQVEAKWSAARNGRMQFESECRLRSADGTFRWNLIRAVPVVKSGKPLTWLGTFTDLEDQKRAEQLIGQKQKLEGIGLLAGGIAHDFNNLLVGIIGALSLALDSLPAENENRPMLEVALNAGERAAHLIRQMLAYAGKGSFLMERIDLSQVVQNTWGLVRPSIPSSIEVQFLTRDGLPPLFADASQIEQIVMNLLLNAAEAIPSNRPGRIIVRTDSERLAQPMANVASDLEPGNYVVLEIRDNGSGMDETVKSRIFDPFFTTKFTGRGLGLAAVQGIVRNLRGAIVVESTPGEGTSFKILFRPAAAAEPVPAAIPLPEVPPRTAAKVLVVDDEQTVLKVARTALERAGYQVDVAASGAEAVEILRPRAGSFDLIVLDLSMPGMSGLETLAELRVLDRDVPVLLASGYSEAVMRQRSEGLSVSGFVQKPFTSKILREKVALHLRTADTPMNSHHAV